MQAATSREAAGGWVITTLRWLWGADDDVGWRELFTATPATWCLLAIFSTVSISDMVLAGSLHVSGPVIERIGQSPAYEALGQVWRFVTTTLINAPETEPPVNALQHLLGNAVLFVLTAPRVERAFGSLRVVVLFIVATICGAVAIYVGAPFYWVPGGGTSHAAYGFVGATLVSAFARRRRSHRDAIYFGVALVALVSSTAATAPTYPTGTNVSHLAGFIAGLVMAAVWCMRPASRRAGVAVAAALVVVAGSLAAARTVDVHRSDVAIQVETPVGFAPVMVTPGFGSLWVTGGGSAAEQDSSGQVVRIDEVSGRVSARIRERGMGGLPVVTKDRVWVAAKGYLIAIDPMRSRIASRVRLADGAWPWSVAATEDALWAAVSDSGKVIRIDLRTRMQTQIAVGPESFVVSAHGSSVWATSYGAKTVSRLDPSTGSVLEQRGLSTAPYQAAFLDGSLWVGAQPFVYRLHPVSLDVIAKINVGRETWTLAPDGRDMLLVTQRYLRSIVHVDPEMNNVARRTEVGLRQPISAAVVGNDLWIADPFTDSVVRTSEPQRRG